MSQTKYKMPKTVRDLCVSLVRNYEGFAELYHKERGDIIHRGHMPLDGMPKGSMSGNGIPNTVIQLEMLSDESQNAKTIRAIEQATVCIGNDLANESDIINLRKAIWESCIEGRNFKFEYKSLPMGKTNFYERRRKFLYNIAKNMGFL